MHRLAEFLHVKPGKGAAFVRTKLKNYITGNVVERTFRGGESVESATLEKKETQFSYVDGDDVRCASHWKLCRKHACASSCRPCMQHHVHARAAAAPGPCCLL
jgi:hypothetical protein